MALNSRLCADVPLRTYSFTHPLARVMFSNEPSSFESFFFPLSMPEKFWSDSRGVFVDSPLIIYLHGCHCIIRNTTWLLPQSRRYCFNRCPSVGLSVKRIIRKAFMRSSLNPIGLWITPVGKIVSMLVSTLLTMGVIGGGSVDECRRLTQPS